MSGDTFNVSVLSSMIWHFNLFVCFDLIFYLFLHQFLTISNLLLSLRHFRWFCCYIVVCFLIIFQGHVQFPSLLLNKLHMLVCFYMHRVWFQMKTSKCLVNKWRMIHQWNSTNVYVISPSVIYKDTSWHIFILFRWLSFKFFLSAMALIPQ